MGTLIDPMFTKMPREYRHMTKFVDSLSTWAWYHNFTYFLIVKDDKVEGGYSIVSEVDTEAINNFLANA